MKHSNSLIDPPESDKETVKKRSSKRKRTKSTRYSGDEYNCDELELAVELPELRNINVQNERYTWDFFYTNDKASNYPFSGFDTVDAVQIIIFALIKLRRKQKQNLIVPYDVVLEIGHGKFPLFWDLRTYFSRFIYFGIEFSSVAFMEAVKQRFENMYTPNEVFDEDVEFLSAKSLHYFKPDGSNNLDLIFPLDNGPSKFKAGIVSIVLGKSFLDYLSCRLTLSVSVSNWNLEPRIPQGVVDMFDSVLSSMKESSPFDKHPPLLILVEPDDVVKFKDHIGIITKVIYTATFVKDSPSKNLRLIYIQRHRNSRAICYGMKKVGSVYKSYNELRNDIMKVANDAYSTDEFQDEDWLLPYKAPPKWLSQDTRDFDNLTLI